MRAGAALHYRQQPITYPVGEANDHRGCAVVVHRGAFGVATQGHDCDHRSMPRFLTLADVAEVLNVSAAQAYALVRTGELPAIQVGGRGQWRIEESRLEEYIAAKYAEAEARMTSAARVALTSLD